MNMAKKHEEMFQYWILHRAYPSVSSAGNLSLHRENVICNQTLPSGSITTPSPTKHILINKKPVMDYLLLFVILGDSWHER